MNNLRIIEKTYLIFIIQIFRTLMKKFSIPKKNLINISFRSTNLTWI